MSKEKKINIEDGNAKEQVLNENAEQNATQNNDNVENKTDEQNAEKTDTKSADTDSRQRILTMRQTRQKLTL